VAEALDAKLEIHLRKNVPESIYWT
jgi:hypothetical protein